MQTFKATFGPRVKIITWLVMVTFFIIILLPFFIRQNYPAWFWYINIPLPLVILLLSYVYHPYQYIIDKTHLTIYRPIGKVPFPLENLTDACTMERTDLKFLIRSFGVGGLFGFYGKFYKKGIGSMTWYASRYSNFVKLEFTDGKKIVLTPDERENFINTVKPKAVQSQV